MTHQSITSENIIIGSLMNNMGLFLELQELKTEYFSVAINKVLLLALKKLFKQGLSSADILDVYAIVESDSKRKKMLDDNGGLDHLDILRTLGEDKTLEEVNSHVDTIVSCAYKNVLQNTLFGISQYLDSNTDATMDEVNEIIDNDIMNVRSKYMKAERIIPIGERLAGIVDVLEKRASSGLSGYPFFSKTLSQFVTYEPGELIVVSAQAKVGKSQLVINETFRLAVKHKIPILVLDTELSDEMFVVRMLARITGYDFKYIKNCKYKNDVEARAKVEQAQAELENSPVYHQYIVGWSNSEIEKEVKRLKIQAKLQIVFFDYLKIDGASDKEYMALGNLTNFLKNDIAGKLKLSVVTFAQMSDYSNTEYVKIADSQRIKNYASTVIFMIKKNKEQYARDFNEQGGNHFLFIPYNRNGAQMDMADCQFGVNIWVNKKNATFKEAQYQCDEVLRLLEEESE